MLVGYARVSTQEQHLHLQIDALKVVGCDLIFQDEASGTSKKRPGLDDALRSLSPGDVLVIWKLDRLGRSLKDLIKIVNDLSIKKTGFRSLTEAIDTTTPGGTLIFHVFGAIAQFERDLIAERTKAGLEAAKKRGRFGGRRQISTDYMLRIWQIKEAYGMETACKKSQRTPRTIRRWEKELKDRKIISQPVK